MSYLHFLRKNCEDSDFLISSFYLSSQCKRVGQLTTNEPFRYKKKNISLPPWAICIEDPEQDRYQCICLNATNNDDDDVRPSMEIRDGHLIRNFCVVKNY